MKDDFAVGVFVGLMVGFMMFLATLEQPMNLGYQEGQVDYANGKVLVHKVENENNELVWKWIDEPKYD